MENSAAMENERLRILRMIEEGKVNAEEGSSLLEALTQGAKNQKTFGRGVGTSTGKSDGPQWFRVRVTNMATGRNKATVNIPFALAEWGLQIGARFAPEIGEFNLAELNRILREQGTEGKIIDVVDEEDGEHVEIYIE